MGTGVFALMLGVRHIYSSETDQVLPSSLLTVNGISIFSINFVNLQKIF
jgi:hypothetical protein